MTLKLTGPEELPDKKGTALVVGHSPGPSSSKQIGNVVSGHMSGRDVNVFANEGDVFLGSKPVSPPPNPFRKLFAKLEKEAQEDKVLNTYIRQLEVYTRRVEDETVIGLEEKLRLGGRGHQITIGAALKENVYADIKANIFSPAYQLIVATLMSKIHERFDAHIRHLIQAGMNEAHIDKAVSDEIIVPISNELDDCPQFEDVSLDYVRGMLYFLTGNCHIRWD